MSGDRGPAPGGPSPGTGRRLIRLAASAAVLVAAACAGGPPPGAAPSSALPPIPEVRGELDLYVAYPDSGDPIAASDSNFIFGTTGTGAAELTIDGHRVRVEPNGAFLAWLPVPERSAGDTARYRLVARAGGEADTLVHPVRLPPRPYRGEGAVWVDTAALSGPGRRWGPPEAVLERTFRAAPGLRAWVEVRPAGRPAPPDTAPGDVPSDTVPADSVPGGDRAGSPAAARSGSRIPLEETAPGRYRLRVALGRLVRAAAPAAPPGAAGDTAARRPPADDGPDGGRAPGAGAPDSLRLVLRATDGRDTAAVEGTLSVRILDPRRLPVATLDEMPDPVHGTAGRVAARPSPHGSYAWRLPPGSSAPVDRRAGDRLRLRLGPDLHAWVAAEDVRIGAEEELPTGRAVPVETVGRVAARPLDDRVRVEVPVGRRLPAHAEPAGPRSLRLVVHGGLGATERMLYGPSDPLLEALRWRQASGPRWVLTVRLSEPVWGWDLRWRDVADAPGAADAPSGGASGRGPEDGPGALPDPGEAGTLVLDVRRPPEIDPGDPLEGVRVAVDAGHPPVGAEGPTGLTEAAANLGVARQLARLLREAGAEPVLVRDDSAAVGLYERRRRAAAAGADLLVSLHNNALPDGLRPRGREGTSTYYFHAHARSLARRVQHGMLETMGLRDRGVRWGNLALPRESWMPSVLTEGAFMMIPRHEAALRTRTFREAYARGVLEGLRGFLEEHAAAADRGGG